MLENFYRSLIDVLYKEGYINQETYRRILKDIKEGGNSNGKYVIEGMEER